MVDYAQAIWIPNNNYFANTGKKSYLILHGTAGGTSAEAIAAYFKSTEGTNNPVSSHYIVGQDGTVVQTIAESNGAWGNGVVTSGHDPWWSDLINPNNITISIEHVKPDDANATPLTSVQQAASFALIKDICTRNNIPMRAADAQGGITGHYSIDPINRSRCPGTFPWDALWAYLANGGNTMNVPSGWSDDGHTLKSPDGTPVALGFRDHVLGSNWDPTNIPLEAEHHDLILEQSNTSLGAGQSQMFRWKRLEYTPKMGVFEGWLGQELLWYQKQYQVMLKQIADLQQQLNKDTQAQQIKALQSQVATLQAQNDQLKALLDASNLGKINSLAKQIEGLSQVQ